jgi:FtsH-binding integral membrane protein
MPMELLSIFNHIGLVYGVGSSTFAIIFFFKALEDGVIDASEKNFMHAVYFVMRLGMIILVITEVIMLLIAFNTDNSAYLNSSTLWMRLLILVFININAVLMHKKIMPMSFGPALAGGSWYSYMAIALFKPTYLPFISIFLFYIAFILAVSLFLKALKRVYLEKKSLF